MSALPEPKLPPVARLRSFHPVLLLLSVIAIVAAAAGLFYLAVVYAHARKAGALFLLVPLAIYGAARIFLPIELTADETQIRWKEPFRTAQVVQRRDIAGIQQRVIRNSSYASFVDREGQERLFVGPIFTPAQMRSFAGAVGLPIRDVPKAPPPSEQLIAADQRSGAEGNRAKGLAVTGTLMVLGVGTLIVVSYFIYQEHRSWVAYQSAPTCSDLPKSKWDCRYHAMAGVSDLHKDSSGRSVFTLTFSTDVFTSGPARQRRAALVASPTSALENGGTADVEVWERDWILFVNGARTDSLRIFESNSNGWWIPMILAIPALASIGFFVWQWRSKPV